MKQASGRDWTIGFASEAEIVAIGEGMIARTLPREAWTHAAHLAAAVYLLRRRPDVTPERDMPDLIRAYNESVGVQNTEVSGYHETITQASLAALRAALADRPDGEPLHRLVNDLASGPLGRSGWLMTYWSRDRLFSPEARRTWIAPDLVAWPY